MSDFDPMNPWHSWADFLFAYMCKQCETTLNLEWPDDGGNEAYLDACVELSQRAKNEGWVYVDDGYFLCPRCASRLKMNA